MVRVMPESQSVDALIAAGAAFQNHDQFAAAVDSYAAALRLEPARKDVKKALLRCLESHAARLLQQANFGAAAAVYRQILEAAPHHAGTLMMLGNALYRAGDLAAASDALGAALKAQPDNLQALALAAIVARALGQPNDRFLQGILESSNADAKYVAMKMWAALELDDPARAFSFDIEGVNVMRWSDLDGLYRQADLQARLQKLPTVTGTPPRDTARPLIFAGADGVYAERFAHELIGSALRNCPNADFHLHLMNPGAFRPDAAFAAFPKDRLSWTIEDMGPADKVKFAPRRWLRLAQMQHAVNRTIIMVDADASFHGDVTKAFPADFDAVLYARPDQPWIHQTVNAGFLAVAPQGRDFTDFLAAYILQFEEAGLSKWFDDQLNIVAARAWFTRKVPGFRIRNAPEHIMDWTGTHRPESLIWHAKGQLKV